MRALAARRAGRWWCWPAAWPPAWAASSRRWSRRCRASPSWMRGWPSAPTGSGRAGAPLPMWLMTSHATDAPIRDGAGRASRRRPGGRLPAAGASLRLTPEGRLFRDDDGELSLHATGHGDLPDALRQSGLLEPLPGRRRPLPVDRQPRQPGRGRRSAATGLARRPRRAADRGGGGQAGRRPRRHPRPPGRAAGGARELPAAGRVRRGRGAGVQHQHLHRRRRSAGRAADAVDVVPRREDGGRTSRHPVRAADRRAHLDSSTAASCGCRARATGSRFLPAKDWDELERNRAQIAARIAPYSLPDRDRP